MDRALTERELDIMNVLWDLGSGTVSEVRDQLEDDLAYTTVLTVIRTLETKGFLRHEGEGKAHRYFPELAREQNAESTLSRLLRTVFQGSPDLLLTHLVQDKSLKPTDIRRLRRLLDARTRGGKG